mgnify:CR=1 FL=1
MEIYIYLINLLFLNTKNMSNRKTLGSFLGSSKVHYQVSCLLQNLYTSASLITPVFLYLLALPVLDPTLPD